MPPNVTLTQPVREPGLFRRLLSQLTLGKALITEGEIRARARKLKCPHCGSGEYGLMPTDFETAKCSKCGKNFDGEAPTVKQGGRTALLAEHERLATTMAKANLRLPRVRGTIHVEADGTISIEENEDA